MARHCAKVGATVLLEWPRYDHYWKEPRVAKFLEELKFRFCDFDGCMYGLRPVDDPHGDTFIQQPWRIATINSTLGDHLKPRVTMITVTIHAKDVIPYLPRDTRRSYA